MSVDHGGTGGQVPQNLEWGTLMQIVLPQILSGTKMSVLYPSKYAKIRFWPGLCPGPRWGAHDAPPDPLVGWRGDTPHTPPTRHGPTFGARHASPQKSSQIYAYD